MQRPQPSNTALERLAIDSRLNLSDGHARQPLFEAGLNLVETFGRYYPEAEQIAQSVAEQRLADAFFGLAAEPSELPTLFSYSASSLVAVIATWLRDERFEVTLLEPGFDNIRDLLLREGVPVRAISADRVMSPQEGGQDHNSTRGRALWLTLPNNPDGFSLSESEFERVATRCRDEGVLLVCDFCFRFYSADMHEWSQYEALLQSGCEFICFEDTGKTLPLLDLKVGMMRCDERLFGDLNHRNEEVILNVSPWLAIALGDLLSLYRQEGLSKTIWQPNRRRGDLVDTWIGENDLIDAGLAVNSVPFRWIRIPTDRPWDAGDLAEAAAARGVHVLPGHHFFFDPADGARFLRVPLGRGESTLKRGAAVLSEIIAADDRLDGA